MDVPLFVWELPLLGCKSGATAGAPDFSLQVSCT